MPGADIMLIEESSIRSVALKDTDHYEVSRSVLTNPDSFWRHLRNEH
jgi:predicted ATPase